MKLNHQQLHNDILINLNKKEMFQAELARELEFSEEVLQGIRKERNILLKNYLKIVEWLEKPMDYYITKT